MSANAAVAITPATSSGPRPERPAATDGEEAEAQPGRGEHDAGGGEGDDEVRRGVRDQGVRRLPGAAGKRGLHHRRPEQRGQQEAAEPGRAEPEPGGTARISARARTRGLADPACGSASGTAEPAELPGHGGLAGRQGTPDVAELAGAV